METLEPISVAQLATRGLGQVAPIDTTWGYYGVLAFATSCLLYFVYVVWRGLSTREVRFGTLRVARDAKPFDYWHHLIACTVMAVVLAFGLFHFLFLS